MQFVPFVFEMREELIDSLEGAIPLPEQGSFGFAEFGIWRGHADLAPLHGEQHLLVPPVGAGFHPGFDRAFRQRRVAIRHDQLLIVAENISEALTLWTGAKRVI